MNLIQNYHLIIDAVACMDEVVSIGKSGGAELPEDKESDIDIFIFCNHSPDIKKREAVIKNSGASISSMTLSETKGRFWGICDFVFLDEIEICFMYFDISDVNNEIASILNGSRLNREDEYFYPTGRCATFLTMHILYDKNDYISTMKNRLSFYPPELSTKLFNNHISKINDEEDFKRAVSRGDVLFYHSIMENALDHYLQALFAFNRCFFPSRKRTTQFIESFLFKPQDCDKRLLKVIELGSKSNTLSSSYIEWISLCNDLAELTNSMDGLT